MVNFKFWKKDKVDLSLPNRTVYLNEFVPEDQQSTHMVHYCTNEVISSQYTLLNFVPKNIFRQFKRAANIFFLLMTVIQLTSTFSIGPPFLAVLPLLSVLVITGIKDALEDWRRHISDRISNDNLVRVIKNFTNTNMIDSFKDSGSTMMQAIKRALGTGSKADFPSFWLENDLNSVDPSKPPIVENVKWMNVRVGDVLVLGSGDFVPADVLILYSSNDEGLCFADSKDLDGETNLKPRNSLAETSVLSSPENINNLSLFVDCSSPTENMFTFNCKVNITENGNVISETSATIRNTLLRGMVVRNTDVVIALVLYTGSQSKIVLNSGDPPFKRSRIEILMNKMVIANFVFLFLLSISISIVGGILYNKYDRFGSDNLFVPGNQSAGTYGIQLFVYSLVMLQNIIPISLYISVEIIKVFHAYFILQDVNMYYEPRNISCTPRNWSISDDMGQIGYIFSDKTGTLTNNVMDFRYCSVNGVVYGKQLPGDELDVVKGNAANLKAEDLNNEMASIFEGSVPVVPKIRDAEPEISNKDGSKYDTEQISIIKTYESALKKVFSPKYISTSDIDNGCPPLTYGFVDPTIFSDMKPESFSNAEKHNLPQWTNPEDQARYLDFFLTQMVVNHTVLVESSKSKVDNEQATVLKKNKKGIFSHHVKESKRNQTQSSKNSGQTKVESNSKSTSSSLTALSNNPNSIKYSAESADEGALVTAARSFGYTFLGRNRDELYVDIKGKELTFRVLATLEFDSVRKRMSTIVRRPAPDNDVVLFTKGADSGMLEILEKVDVNDEASLERHRQMFNQIDEFANSGLRTLVFGYRKISDQELASFMSNYNAALNYIGDDRQERLLDVYKTIEKGLEFIASTGIEDRLQDKVPDCIASLRAAGIRIWVLTGDKLETAINIGFASNLLSKGMELWTLDGKKSAQDTLNKFWLMSKLIRRAFSLPVSSGSNNQSLSLSQTETRMLKKISYRIKKMSKYFTHFKNKKGGALSDIQIVNQSIRNLQANSSDSGSSIMVMQPFGSNQFENNNITNEMRVNDLSDDHLLPDPEDHAENRNSTEDALVVDGRALAHILENAEANEELRMLAPMFKSVICARASPLQKAQVVNLIKKGHDYITLAIGDGANDVSMIQAADVGVAIIGEEGLQAANAADYSIPRFHHLQNLLLVHGLFNYLRISESVLVFFYKNTVWAMAPFFFTIFSRYSGNFFFDAYYIQLYNLVFTSIPVIVLGCVDKPFNYKTALIYTNVYKAGINNNRFSNKKFAYAMMDGIYQSCVLFLSVFLMLGYPSQFTQSNGRQWSMFDASTAVAFMIVIAATLSVALTVWSLNWMMFASIIFSIAALFISSVIFSSVSTEFLRGLNNSLLSSLQFYAMLLVFLVVALLPRFIAMYYSRFMNPKDVDIVREIKVLHRPWYGQVYLDKDEALEGPRT
ncbi:putative phospholipid-transporting ATPase VA [Smittium mucronatum]|uniref:Putative phospholipid-transporting ATPase VA n=1 Tax=Smittium mucronatum TaxID=133383 RepID=A0A1R0H6A3_9FUNG|nr:putative phospholipid-transporting ATPase VA [Smittium mucronatum]